MKLAYLSRGKLYVRDEGPQFTMIDSKFGQELVERTARAYEKSAWKRDKSEGNLVSGAVLWNVNEVDPTAVQVRITGVTRGRHDRELLYALETDTIGGLFLYDWSTHQERRLFHRERFRIKDLGRHPTEPLIVGSMAQPNGTANLVLVEQERAFVEEITGGDSADEAPAWVPGAKRRLVFQSTGLARNEAGHFAGWGPTTVMRLDLEAGSLETVAEDPALDFLLPRQADEDTLYFVRRPYEPPDRRFRPSLLGTLRDTVALPYRLFVALFAYLNFFSLIYARKPLMKAGGPPQEGPEVEKLMIRGRVIDARRALREHLWNREFPSLVPKSWELVERRRGEERVLARGVLAYDLFTDGSLVYTNGTGLFRVDPAGPAEEALGKGGLVEHLAVLG